MKIIRFFIASLLLAVALLPVNGQNREYDIKSDNVLRFYHVALPVAFSSFEKNFDCNYNEVLNFWNECELYLNKAFLPLGFCFNVLRDEAFVMKEKNLIDENHYNSTSYGTELLDEAVGAESYDAGLWIAYRPEYSENTGLSIEGGAYSAATKASGYAVPDKWVVAHEMGHLFGANHTMDATLMDVGGDFFSPESIERIRRSNAERNAAYYSDVERTQLVGDNKGGNYVYGVKVSNSAPLFDGSAMRNHYRAPQGACLSFRLHVTDADGDNLRYIAAGDCFSVTPSGTDVIDYAPSYLADVNYDDYYIVEGTDIPSMGAGDYNISFVVNDAPADSSYSYEDILLSPFYSLYDVWSATVQIVAGTPFNVSLFPGKDCYSAGEEVTVEWGVNRGYFNEGSRLRILLSDDFGKSYKYTLASDVPALDGVCRVTLPNVNIGSVDADFYTAQRAMRGGIIRIEEIGGVAFALSECSPHKGGGFLVEVSTDIDNAFCGDKEGVCYDTAGRRIYASSKSILIKNRKKFLFE